MYIPTYSNLQTQLEESALVQRGSSTPMKYLHSSLDNLPNDLAQQQMPDFDESHVEMPHLESTSSLKNFAEHGRSIHEVSARLAKKNMYLLG